MFESNYFNSVLVVIIILLLTACGGPAKEWQDTDLNLDGKVIDFQITTISEADQNLDGNYEVRRVSKQKTRSEFEDCKAQKICLSTSQPVQSFFVRQGPKVIWDIGFEDSMDKMAPEVINYEGDISWPYQVQLYLMKHAQKSEGIISIQGEFREFPDYERRMEKFIEEMKVINADTREIEGVKKFTRAQVSKKSAQSAVEFFYSYLPKSPVIEGESWENKVISHAWHPRVYEFIYTLEEITSDHYVLDISGTVSEFKDIYPRRLIGNAMEQKIDGEITGRILVNRETNFPDSLRIKTDERIIARYWPAESSFEEWGREHEYNTKMNYRFETR